MNRLWDKPFELGQYLKPALSCGPTILWYYALINDHCLNHGKNKLKFLLFYTGLNVLFFWFILKLRYFEKFFSLTIQWLDLIILFAVNIGILLFSEKFQRISHGEKFDHYDTTIGKYNNSKPQKYFGPLIPLSIVVIIYQIFRFILTLF